MSLSTSIYNINVKYANDPGISIWVITICFSVGKNYDIVTRCRWVNHVLLAIYVIGCVSYLENLMSIEMIVFEENFILT